MDAIRVGLDLAKRLCSLHCVDANGKEVLQRTVSREKLVALLANPPLCLIGTEASSGAHHWVRVLSAAILDRLLHHAHVLDIKGRTYRLRDLENALAGSLARKL